jgi:hypothetical protein
MKALPIKRKGKIVMVKGKANQEVKRNKLDSFVYWVTQLALVVLATAGLVSFLQPVEPVLSYPITALLVGCIMYISQKNR